MDRAQTFKAHRVVCFSSQYGTDNSRSYTAGNLAGEANNFPRYGDFTQAFVLRTYGPWWDLSPSSRLPVKKTGNIFISEDFVDLQYPHLIYPTKIEILETYNPGSVVRILALQLTKFNSTSKQRSWTILWSGAPQNCPPKARKFSPPLKKTKYPTNLIRLEFNQSHLKYYTELDAVLLSGKHADLDSQAVSASHMSEISDLRTSLTANLLRQLSLSERKNELHDEPRGNGVFDILPSELIQCIFSYLELMDLIRAAPTCRLFFLHCYDPVWYKELDLRPYWNLVNNQALDALRKRCTSTEKLDLSWCGPYGAIDATGMNRYIECCGSKLVCLRLSCCTFVDNQVIQAVCQWCSNLEELDLQSCDSKRLNDNGLLRLQLLKKLKRVNLYRVLVTDQVLQALIQSCASLQHLNIGGNMFVVNCDFMMRLLGHHCSGLVSLDLWRSKSLTADGVRCVADGCVFLEELDLGWCTNVNAATGCLVYLTSKCRKLKKLFLTAIRSVSDSDVVALADNCPDMQQVDMLGTALVHPNSVMRLLTMCKRLRLLDVSFCSQLTAKIIANLRSMNPHVSIKKSFVTEEQE